MKIRVLSVLVILASITNVAIGGGIFSWGSSAAESEVRVLVVGFENTQLNSNYFLRDEIAEMTELPEDSIGYHFNTNLIKTLTNSDSRRVELIPVTDNSFLAYFYKSVSYVESNDRVRSEFQNSDASKVKDIVSLHNADYILFMNSYELRWQGNPFNTLFHIINYDILNYSLENIYNGVASFGHAELTPLYKVERKMNRQASRIISQVSRNTRQ